MSRRTYLPPLGHEFSDEYHRVGRNHLRHDRESDCDCGRTYEAGDWWYLSDFGQEFRHGVSGVEDDVSEVR